MSFGTTFADTAAAMEGEEVEVGEVADSEGLLAGVELPPVDDFSVPWNKAFGPDPRVEAHATNRAHAAYRDAGAGSYPYPRAMNVVITFTDAARVLAHRGLNALGRKLLDIAERIAPTR